MSNDPDGETTRPRTDGELAGLIDRAALAEAEARAARCEVENALLTAEIDQAIAERKEEHAWRIKASLAHETEKAELLTAVRNLLARHDARPAPYYLETLRIGTDLAAAVDTDVEDARALLARLGTP